RDWSSDVCSSDLFTAHPTFLLTPDQAQAVDEAAASPTPVDRSVCAVPARREKITLTFEHRQAMKAIAYAQDARDRLVAGLLEEARQRWPAEWQSFRPLPFRFASWVGYDMDGRTDIKWFRSIGFRLAAKAERLERYAARLDAIDPSHDLLETVRAAGHHAAERAGDFAGDLSDPDRLSAAANRLTADDPARLLSLTPIIEKLEREAQDAPAERAIALKMLACAMRADGLGMGWIHFRVHAKQLHNAIRRRLDPKGEIDLGSKVALVHLRRAIAGDKPLRPN